MTRQVDVEKVLTELKRIAATAVNEEEFKINAERVLYDEVISKLGLKPGRYEYTFVSGGRADALYGHVIIEYKAPGKLSRTSDIARAKEQLIGYIKKEAEVEKRYRHFLGVILSDKIAFVRYDFKTKDWVLRGPYELNRETVLRLIEAIRGLRRKKLAVDEILRDFGPKSMTTRRAVRAFYNKIIKSRNPKVRALFNDWKRLFSQVCAYSPEKLKGLEKEYGMIGQVNYDALLFSIHTYYALIMKLLGAEIAYLYGAGRWLKSYVSELEDAYMRGLDSLKRSLEELESGGVFRRLLNITNFIEGDYFSWYLEELDKELADAISEIAKKLTDYEPATSVLEPEYTRDLLKRLYQNLVPKKIRHDLGEYYTPDWLAELVLNEVGLTVENLEKIAKEKNDTLAPLNLRILDPACGSGTFLILTIKRFREHAEKHYLNDILAEYLLKNVVGFDLNPLAVLAARTNYLLAIAYLLPYVKGPIEIPIYLADSLLVEARTTLTGTTYVIKTSVGEFQVPKSIVDKGILGRLLESIDRYVRLRYRVEDFKQVVKNELNLDENELQLIGDLYKTFLKLEREGKNHVWASIIKNAFAPLTITSSSGKFDYVIGNPPWINWEHLPENYRNKTKRLWDVYGLLKMTKGVGLGKVKRDIAMLFLARCLDRYVKEDGGLSFLIPFTTYKTQAGAGFREFLANKCEVLKIHDLVALYPFEGATNMTSLIVVKKKGKTKFPIQCIMWHNPRSRRMEQDAELDEVMKMTKRFKLSFIPIKKNDPGSPWMEITEKAYEGIKKVIGSSPWYKAYAGVYTALNQVYWVEVLDETPQGLLIRNPILPGQKKKVKVVKTIVEKDLVYPLVRGRDVKKWYVKGELGYIVVPADENGKTISHSDLRVKYPKTYQYFLNFVNDLVNRGGEPYKTKLKPYREMSFERAERIAPPFYWLFNVKPSLAPYKVIWKEISSKAPGKAELQACVLSPISDKILGDRIVIPDHKVMLIPLKNEEEAHYITAILNSNILSLAISAYTVETSIDPKAVVHINIPKFDPNNQLHRNLSKLSRKAHEIAKEIYEKGKKELKTDLKEVEEEIDRLVAQLYGITNDELKEIRRCLAILKGEEVEEEEVEEEPREVKVDFLNTVVWPNAIGSFEVAVLNPLKDKVVIEIKLPDRLVRLETDKEEESFRVRVPRLEAGEYKVPYKVTTSKGVTEGTFTLYVKEEERRRVREALRSRLDERLGD